MTTGDGPRTLTAAPTLTAFKQSPPSTVDRVLRLRKQLLEAGHDAGADTVRWHLEHHHRVTLSLATEHRILTRHSAVTPETKKRPKSLRVHGQLLRELTIDPGRDYQPRNAKDPNPQ